MPIQTTWRARNFGELIGNEDVVASVKAALKSNDPNHAILITGPSGTGKTTLARIIAMRLGAYDPDSLSNSGFREINAGDMRGIDAVRAIGAEASRMPLGGGNRVFFVDECHRMTPDAQEMWLKILEEAAGYNWFIFATTNPETLKTTFLRRPAKYEMKPLPDGAIVKYLTDICDEEGIDATEDVLQAIVSDCMGSMGIAMGILDAIKGLSAEQMLQAAQTQAAKQNAVIELCRVLVDKKCTWAAIRPILANLKEQGEDAEGIRRMVLGYCSSILLKKDEPRMFIIMDAFHEPMYNIGFPGVIFACYAASKG